MDFYYLPGSAPCRSILLLCKALGIKLNLKYTDLAAGDHLKPEFVKINYQHCVPTLVDNGFAMWESRAILAYLVDKYAKNDALYPKDPQKRFLVNQKLYFDMGTLYQSFANYYYPVLFEKAPLNPEAYKKMKEAVGFLNTALEGKKYAAGDSVTIADFALVASISTFDGFKFDFKNYPNVAQWYERCKKTMVGYEVNQEGVDEFVNEFWPQLPK